MSDIIYKSVIRCPFCGFEKEETMAGDACQFFYECKNCMKIIRPQKGDCCVFCSYGTVKCPSIQRERLKSDLRKTNEWKNKNTNN